MLGRRPNRLGLFESSKPSRTRFSEPPFISIVRMDFAFHCVAKSLSNPIGDRLVGCVCTKGSCGWKRRLSPTSPPFPLVVCCMGTLLCSLLSCAGGFSGTNHQDNIISLSPCVCCSHRVPPIPLPCRSTPKMSRLVLSPSIQQLVLMSMLCCCLVVSEVGVTLLHEGLMHDGTTGSVL